MKVRFLSFVMAVLSLCTGCMGEDSFAEENARLEVDELLVLDGMKNSVEFNYKSFCVLFRLEVLKLITSAMCGSNCIRLSDNVLT